MRESTEGSGILFRVEISTEMVVPRVPVRMGVPREVGVPRGPTTHLQ